METTSALTVLFANGNTVPCPVFGKGVTIRKASLRTISGSLAFVETLLTDLQLDGNNLPQVDITSPLLIVKLISKYTDQVLAIVAAHSDVTMEELLDMDADESLAVVMGVVILNKDFFMNRIANLMATMMPSSALPEPQETAATEG